MMTFGKHTQRFSFARMNGLIRKEFILILRDKGTIAMLVVLPVMLLIVFGFAIDLDPKHLPTAIVSFDNSPLTRSFISGLDTSRYFNIIENTDDIANVKQKLRSGFLSFMILIPANFTRKFVRGENPELLVEIDGSDPGSSATALSHIQPILDRAISDFKARDLAVAYPHSTAQSVHLITHRLYNEANISAYNIVTGLIGVLLTLTMVMLTSTAITTETEAGTMELLLSTPLSPMEIILGKVISYI